MDRRFPFWWWALAHCAVAFLVARQLIEMDRTASLILAVLLIPPAAWFYITVLAKGLHVIRMRGMPTAADLAAAPQMRWHTPACVTESTTTFELRTECTISVADVQSVNAGATSTNPNDSVEPRNFNEQGMHLVGQFTFCVRGQNATVTQAPRKVRWHVTYFDTQGRFGYTTHCWAEVTF